MMAAKRTNKICFTVQELLLLIFMVRRQLVTGDIPKEAQEVGVRILGIPGSGTRKGLDDDYIRSISEFLASAPGLDRQAAAEQVITQAIKPQPKTGIGDKIFDTGGAITMLGTAIAKIPFPVTIAIGEFLEVVGLITGITGGFVGQIEEIWE